METKYGICKLSVIPIRASASDKSEIVSQVLFGELLAIKQVKGNWAQIKCLWDDYEGWIDSRQYHYIEFDTVEAIQNDYACSLELMQAVMGNDFYVPVLLGSSLPHYDGMNLHLQNYAFTYSGNVIHPKEIQANQELLVKIARKYLYAPYLWGGRSPFGIDCSGLTQMVFKLLGISIPRDARQQVHLGDTVYLLEEAQVGDLAFFDNDKGAIVHVGIILNDMQIIHASASVRIDNIDHHGIFNKEQNRYSHKLRVIKRLLPNSIPSDTD